MIDVLKTSALFTAFAGVMGAVLFGVNLAVTAGAGAATEALRVAAVLLPVG